MPKCDGDYLPGSDECDCEALYVERGIESKRFIRKVCQKHAFSFNPDSEFVPIEDAEADTTISSCSAGAASETRSIMLSLLEECLENGDAGREQLFAWFEAEHECIVSAIEDAGAR